MRGVNGNDSTGFLRQADAAKDAGDIRSDGGSDGCRRRRCVVGLSDKRLVGLSALVLAGIGVVDMLVSVSFAGDMEEDVAIRQCSDARGQHRGGRQCDADAAHQRLPVNLFGADGLYDGFAHADHDEIPAQPAKARSAARGYASSDKESGSAFGDGRTDALCRYAVGRCRCPRRAARHAAADSCLLRGQYIGGRDSIGDDQGEEQGVPPQRMNTDLT